MLNKVMAGLLAILVLLACPRPATAPKYDFSQTQRQLKETETLQAFFKSYGCKWPRESTRVFVDVAYKYDLPVYLLPAIGVVESGCGKAVIYDSNPFGFAHGRRDFSSLDDAINHIGRTLSQGQAYQRFQRTGKVEDLSRVYAEDKSHAKKVKAVMEKIRRYE